MSSPVREGTHADLVSHCSVFGRSVTPVRWFRVGEARPYAQYARSVDVFFIEPRKRKKYVMQAHEGGPRFITIEVQGQTVYDSRTEVPVDMDKWEADRIRLLSRRGGIRMTTQ